jgi:hypothetical protein
VRWVILLVGLSSIAILSLIDCKNRSADQFAGGEEDKQAWIRWLWIAVATAWIGVGNGIVLGYFYAVVKRNTMRT